MREFLQVLRRFVPPYKKYLAWSVFFNILSAVLNIFSFMTLIPILQILFNTKDVTPVEKLITWDSVHGVESMVDMLTNNVNYYIQHYIASAGAANTLLVIWFVFGTDDPIKDGCLFLFFGHHHSHSHRCGARYSQSTLSKNQCLVAEFL